MTLTIPATPDLSSQAVASHPALPGVTATFELVTPELAERYLTMLPERQRSQSDTTVAKYSGDMVSGHYFYGGDTIRFDTDGHLFDGQHRMVSVVRSGKPQVMLVIRGLPRKAIYVTDTGRPRSLGDMLRIDGVPNHSAVAALIKKVLYWQLGNYGVSNVGRWVNSRFVHQALSLPALLECFEPERDDIISAAKQGLRVATYFPPRTCQPAVLGFAWLYFGRLDLDLREGFFHQLEHGPDKTHPGYPLARLRNKMLLGVRPGDERKPDWVWQNWMFGAWNCLVRGDNLPELRQPKAEWDKVAIPIDPYAETRPAGWEPL